MEIKIKEEWRKLNITNYYDLYYIMKDILMSEGPAGRDQEHFWVLGLANNLKLRYIDLVSLGSISATVLEPMQVFQLALLKRVPKIIMVHNHPGQDIEFHELKPSEEDNDITDRMIHVGDYIKIEVLEHMIITERFFFSYKQSGLLEELQRSTKHVPHYILKERFLEEAMKTAEKTVLKKGKEMERERMIKRAYKEGVPIKTIASMASITQAKVKEILGIK